MAMHTITAMFNSRESAERAASTLRSDTSLSTTNVKVLPEDDQLGGTGATTTAAETDAGSHGFMASLRNFFMPEEDRMGYAEGLRRGSYMVAADVEEAHAHRVMDVLEEAGAVDLDAEEARWRSEGWKGYEPSSSATASSGTLAGTSSATGVTNPATIPPIPGAVGSTATDVEPAPSLNAATAPVAGTGPITTGTTGTMAGRGTVEESIPLVEETLRVGKRQVVAGRVRIRSYVVEKPVTETVNLRDERVEVERRAVDRPLTGNEADPFREREIVATETREEPVVSKEARVREELVLHKSVEEHDETVRDTVRHTEVKEERGAEVEPAAVRNPQGERKI